MKIGYPCINRSVIGGCSKTFSLRQFSKELFAEVVEYNLESLMRILRYNVEHDIRFFRISSNLIPHATYLVDRFDWVEHFENSFKEIGNYIKEKDIRISTHPDQFTLINSPDFNIFRRSSVELEFHATILDLLGLDETAKIQIHVGGVYDDKAMSMKRFIDRYDILPDFIQKRLVIENDEKLFNFKDCLGISFYTGIPVVLDVFHHELFGFGEQVSELLASFINTWQEKDGLPMIDYSSQEKNEKRGVHARSLNVEHFKEFVSSSQPYDFDIMLELRDNEQSALKAAEIVKKDKRFFRS